MDPLLQRLLIGFVINLLWGIVAFMKEMVDDTGFFTGVVLFTLIYVFLDWPAYVMIVTFFLITGACIDIENRDKANKGDFELYKAKRPMDRVLGRSLAGAVFAGLFFVTNRPEFKLAFVASYAESVFDTVSTKLGKLLSRTSAMIIGFKKVNHGTPGGISWQGTALGVIASIVVGAVAFLVRLITKKGLGVIILSAMIGSTIDSFLNAFSYRKRHIPNEVINFIGSLCAGIAAIGIAWFLYIMTGLDIYRIRPGR